LDAASILAVEALDVQPNESILDICAAPGGKSIAILQKLSPHGTLHCNELSTERRKRLLQVLKDYLPPSMFSRVSVTGNDATKSKTFVEGRYDKVLVDAPCSSERHLLHDKEELSKWTTSRWLLLLLLFGISFF
jgi:16S rRNA C967 or C1407 C5-methylase (RsmB/RsmF family)